MVVDFARLKGGEPPAVHTRPHQSGLGVHHRPVPGGTAQVFVCERLVSGRAGQLGNAPVVVGVFQGFGNGFGGVFDAEEAVFSVGGQAKNRGVGGGVGRPQGGLQRKPAVSLGVCVGNHRDGVVPNHAVGFVGRQFPHRKSAALGKVVQHRRDEGFGAFRLRQGIEGMCRAVGVPQAEDGVAGVHGVAVHRVVHAPVPTVHVAPQVGNGKTVVQRRAENHFLVRRAVHFDFAQLALPFVGGRGAGAVKRRLALYLRLQVAQGTGFVGGRQGDVQGHKSVAGPGSGCKFQRVQTRFGLAQGVRHRRLEGKKEFLAGGPGAGKPTSGGGLRSGGRQGVFVGFVPVLHAYQYPKRLTGIGPVPVASHPLRCGEFGTNSVGKLNGIIPRFGDFCQVVVGRGVLEGDGAVFGSQRPALGQDQEVAVVADAGAAEVGVGKAVERGVRKMVAAASVPAFQPGVWTQLDHAEGALGAGVGVAVAPGPNTEVGHRRCQGGGSLVGRGGKGRRGFRCGGFLSGGFHTDAARGSSRLLRRSRCLTHCVTGRQHCANGPKNNPFHRAHAQR